MVQMKLNPKTNYKRSKVRMKNQLRLRINQ